MPPEQASASLDWPQGWVRCAWCKKVRNDSGYWEQIENYISTRSSALFTHGVCPDCQEKFLDGIGKASAGV